MITAEPFQPIEEKEEERKLITRYLSYLEREGSKIEDTILQDDIDNGGADGTSVIDGRRRALEARRKGYPDHKGETFTFYGGWHDWNVRDGIFLNEDTIRNHKETGFDFIVEIAGYNPRFCHISKERIEELLSQPYRESRSRNSGVMQSVKLVPLKWFEEFE